jgi:hypothetical protein
MSDESKASAEARFIDDLEKAAIETAVEQLRSIHRAKQVRRSPVLPGSGSCADITRPLEDPWFGAFVFEAARTQLETYNRLLDLSSRYADHIIDYLRAVLPGGRGTNAPAAIEIAAPPGAPVSSRFLVENRLISMAKVTFAPKLLHFRDESGVERFRISYRIKPVPSSNQKPILRPGEPRVYRLTFKVPDEEKLVNERFESQLIVALHRSPRGRQKAVQDELPIQLDVTVKKPYA